MKVGLLLRGPLKYECPKFGQWCSPGAQISLVDLGPRSQCRQNRPKTDEKKDQNSLKWVSMAWELAHNLKPSCVLFEYCETE